ncbi:MAG: peptide ABC transporter substrate-binding protein [Myxococcaceae bacterium]|nr:peptide ABC transporter substrate-binding protein [Myxococcaceae bacterium]
MKKGDRLLFCATSPSKAPGLKGPRRPERVAQKSSLSPFFLFCLLALPAFAGSRARYGGALQVALSGKPAEADGLYADTPAEASLLALTHRALCLAPFTVSRPSPTTVRIEVPASVKALDVVAHLKRVQNEPSPYRALLAPVSQVLVSGNAVELKLAYAWPDLDSALCHPALALPNAGPFKLSPTAGRYTADGAYAAGRPYLDEIIVTSTDDRGAERLFSQRKAHLAVGLLPKPELEKVQLPFATALLFSPSLGAGFRAAFETSVDRTDLVRFFVRPPAAPLLPGTPQTKPAPLSPVREVTLLYDASLDDQRAVAARLQVRLNPLGYRVALKPLPRRELRARWAKGDYELMLFSSLLPPRASSALALVLETARATDLAAKHLPALGALDDDARDEKAKELLVSLGPSLNALPLYVQGLSLAVGPQVFNLKLDAWGLPKLDDVFLGAE